MGRGAATPARTRRIGRGPGPGPNSSIGYVGTARRRASHPGASTAASRPPATKEENNLGEYSNAQDTDAPIFINIIREAIFKGNGDTTALESDEANQPHQLEDTGIGETTGLYTPLHTRRLEVKLMPYVVVVFRRAAESEIEWARRAPGMARESGGSRKARTGIIDGGTDTAPLTIIIAFITTPANPRKAMIVIKPINRHRDANLPSLITTTARGRTARLPRPRTISSPIAPPLMNVIMLMKTIEVTSTPALPRVRYWTMRPKGFRQRYHRNAERAPRP